MRDEEKENKNPNITYWGLLTKYNPEGSELDNAKRNITAGQYVYPKIRYSFCKGISYTMKQMK